MNKNRSENSEFESPLSGLKVKEKGRISRVALHDSKKLQMLMSMGVFPGVELSVLQRFPSVLFQIGHSQFAIDSEVAKTIFVHQH
jgi:DtxR family transcriptional regulator, Mn-dependent transcriptional regulator